MKKYELNLNDRAFNAIINRTKRIELRASSDEKNYNEYEANDKIIFKNSKNEEILCEIKENNHYDTLEELLMLEGTRYTTSSTNSYDEAITNILKLSEYKERINKNGINAIHIQYLYQISDVWNKLYLEAKKVLNPRTVSESVDAGGVATAILTTNGNIYTGVCIDTACSLGFCAERNAIGTMITNGENEIEKLLCIGSHNDNIMMPCGACRELLLQLSEKNKNMEIITDLNTLQTIKLIELMPRWWK